MRLNFRSQRRVMARKGSPPRERFLSRRPVFELLEQRRLLAVTWDGGANNNLWNSDANWSGDMRPTANDDVIIPATAPASIVLQESAVSIKSFDVQTSLVLNTAFSVTNGGQVSGSVTVSATMTLGGQNTIGSLSVSDGGKVTSFTGQSLQLTVHGDVTIAALGSIDVTGRGTDTVESRGMGQAGGTVLSGGGGGGHGGRGGSGRGSFAGPGGVGGATYGSVTHPVDFGSSGGTGDANRALGAVGGGVIRLVVDGTLTNHGVVSANGSSTTRAEGGGGAGGSIWITTNSMVGTGVFSANGGHAVSVAEQVGGGGGGGRIAVYSQTNSFLGAIAAYGGTGSEIGGAGTVYLDAQSASRPQLIIDNGGRAGALTSFVGPTDVTGDMIVRNGGRVGSTAGQALHLTVHGDATIGPTGSIDVTGLGSAALESRGMGQEANNNYSGGGGGGYGGRGGTGQESFLGPGGGGGATYGSVTQPIDFGSSGADGDLDRRPGGPGGGVIRLVVDGTLRNDGSVLANGAGSLAAGGAGSGGSVWVTTNSLAGIGVISANGGDVLIGEYRGGGGGGGRVAVYSQTDTFLGLVTAYGGTGPQFGGAGTVYLDTQSASRSRLIVDNNGNAGAPTSFLGPTDVTGDMIVRNRGRVGSTAGQALQLTVHGNFTLAATGSIDVTGLGSALESRGMGQVANNSFSGAGGGGHGGRGGTGQESFLGPGGVGGGTYGSVTQPIDFGSSGASGDNNRRPGGSGGGVIRLIVDGTLVIDGMVSANGTGALAAGGAGSGGSVWITTNSLTGAGVIQANGGEVPAASGNPWIGGGGGGGRIAVYSQTDVFLGTVTAYGGTGRQFGGAGTVFLDTQSASRPQLIIDNNRNAGAATPISGFSELNGQLIVSGGGFAIADGPMVISGDIRTQTGGVLRGASLDVRGYGWINSDPSASILVNGNLAGNTTNGDVYNPHGLLRFDGSGTPASPQLLEIMSRNAGNTPDGYVDNYAYGTVALANNTYVRLVDQSDNARRRRTGIAVCRHTRRASRNDARSKRSLRLCPSIPDQWGRIRRNHHGGSR